MAVMCLSSVALVLVLLPRFVFLAVSDLAIGFTRPVWGTTDVPSYPVVLPSRPALVSSSETSHNSSVPTWSFRDDNLTCERIGWTKASTKGPKKRVFDTFIFSNELDLLELRLWELEGTVDAFILVESELTHTNLHKPLWWRDVGALDARFARWHHLIESVVVPRGTLSARAHFRHSGAWGLEALQRKQIMRGLSRRGIRAGDMV